MRFGIQFKLVVGLLLIAIVPLLVSALLVDQIGEVAQNFASNEADRLRPPLVKAERAYRELVAARKAAYREAGRRIAGRLRGLPLWTPEVDVAAAQRELGRLLAQEEVARAVVTRADGTIVAQAVSDLLPGQPTGRWRDFTVVEPLVDGLRLELTFVARVDFLDDLEELGYVLAERRDVDAFRRGLPRSYRTAFLLLVGGVVVVVTAASLVLARRITRRVEQLAAGTREVARGNLAARVDVPGRDELGELSDAFNRMVEQLEQHRAQIGHLQKMSAWQDVARRLAHEIKNPLTPIQLAVQQVVSSYRGNDERYAAMLRDMQEIVEEEIAGLRRLVDAFRSLSRLPRAQPEPLDVAVVVADLAREPEFTDRLAVTPPADAVTVRGDRLLLRRLLANLVENAVHAAPDGRVYLAWERDGDVARVYVDDEGPGVPPDRRDAIFEPYITSKEHGTGLGLAIAKKIALDHGGDLALAPEPAPAGGARFVVTLPVAAPA